MPFLQARSSDSEVMQSAKTTEQVWQNEESCLPVPDTMQQIYKATPSTVWFCKLTNIIGTSACYGFMVLSENCFLFLK